MKQIGLKLQQYLARMRRALLGSKVLEPRMRPVFLDEITQTTCQRTLVILCIFFVIQASNLLLHKARLYHSPEAAGILQLGVYWQLAVGVMFGILLALVRHGLIPTRPAGSIIVKVCWAAITAGMLFFVYADLTEAATLTNYVIMILAVGVIPLMSFPKLFAFIGLSTIFCYILAARAQLPANLMQQMLIISLLSLYSGQVRYASTLQSFQERERLSESNRKLEYLSQTDQLTGLLNRRGLSVGVAQMAQCKGEAALAPCVLMVDIDFFKNYNDKYLHLAGDRCLARVASCLKKSARSCTDLVARYGGEEFVVVTLNLDASSLLCLALRLKQAIEDLRIPFGLDEAHPYITASIGVARTKPRKGEPLEEALSRALLEADKALYQAKNSGRNCVCLNGEIHR